MYLAALGDSPLYIEGSSVSPSPPPSLVKSIRMASSSLPVTSAAHISEENVS
jgi:hypothetical protein